MIRKLKTSIVILSLIAGLYTVLVPRVALAAPTTPGPCKSGYAHPLDNKGDPLPGCSIKKTPGECPSGDVDGRDATKCQPLGNLSEECPKRWGVCANNPIVKDLNLIVNVLTGLAGVAIVGAIILGGIQYSIAGDKAEAVSAAKKRITNGLIALLAFLFIFAFLQWLVPGGVFR